MRATWVGWVLLLFGCARTPVGGETNHATNAGPPSPSVAAPPVVDEEAPPPAPERPPPAGPDGEIVEIVASWGVVCARFANQTLQCLSIDRTPTERWSPKATKERVLAAGLVGGIPGVTGRCVWSSDGRLHCAESGGHCGTTTRRFKGSAAVRPNAGRCVDQSDGTVACFKEIACPSPDRLRNVVEASAGGQVCARLSDASVACVDPFSPSVLEVPAARGALALRASRYETCALMPTGGVQCWGVGEQWENQSEAQSPAATRPPYAPTPRLMDHLENVIAFDVDGDGDHSCAVVKNGSVLCWGANDHGQLGDGTKIERAEPVKVLGLADAVEVRVTSGRSCARLRDGTVRCWGENEAGAIDRSGVDRPTPTRVAIVDSAQIAMAGPLMCTRSRTHQVSCWGCAIAARCGRGYTPEMARQDAAVARNGCSTPMPIAWAP